MRPTGPTYCESLEYAGWPVVLRHRRPVRTFVARDSGPTPSDDGPAAVHRSRARGPGRRGEPPWSRNAPPPSPPDRLRRRWPRTRVVRPHRPARRPGRRNRPAVADSGNGPVQQAAGSCSRPRAGGGSGKWLVRELEAYDDATGPAYTSRLHGGWWRRCGASVDALVAWPRRSWQAHGGRLCRATGSGLTAQGEAGQALRAADRGTAAGGTCPPSSPMVPASASLS